MEWIIRFYCALVLAVSMATLCLCFPAAEQEETALTNSTEVGKNDVIAIFLHRPESGKMIDIKDKEMRKFREIYNWLQPLFSAASQATGTAGSTASGFFSNLFGGGQNTYAYPFPFRR